MIREQASPLEFPCRFPINAVGLAERDLEGLVVSIIRRHAPALIEGDSVSRPSRGERYLAVTVTTEATSRQQLDAIYEDLSGHARVLMVL